MAKKHSTAFIRQQWQRADHEQRRDLIVDAALELLAEQGLAGVTMRRVAGRLSIGAMTVYTYIDGQPELQKEMIRRGVCLLNQACQGPDNSDPGMQYNWRQDAGLYVRFALDHPNLYRLMFNEPQIAKDDLALIQAGYDNWLEQVREHLKHKGLPDEQAMRQAREQTGRFWAAVHGLASLAIDGRLRLVDLDWEKLLDDLTDRLAPQSS